MRLTILAAGLGAGLIASTFAVMPSIALGADDVMVICANVPEHSGCTKSNHFKVSEEAEGKAAFEKMRAELFDPQDPVAQVLSYSKWGANYGFKDTVSESFIYAVEQE